MPIFEYRALTLCGGERRGSVDADTPAEARRKLRAANVHVLELREGRAGRARPDALEARTIRLRGIGQRDLAVACRQLATLLRAGMPLVPALTALAEQFADEPMGKVLARVRDRVNEGATLAAAMQEHPRVFPELYVNMVEAGEAAGALTDVLTRLAEMTERRVSLMHRVRSALAYPVLMSVVGIGVVAFLLAFVVPSITRLFEEMNRTLPGPTVALISISEFVRGNAVVLLGGLAAGVVALRLYVRTPGGRLAWDRLKLRIPLLGDLVLKSSVSHFARTLGVLLMSNVAILEALNIVKRVVGNAVIRRALDDTREAVRHGDSIAGSLRRSGVFPPIVLHMIAAGEASGSVAEGLIHVADAYDTETEARVNAMTSLLEPLLILLLGAIVGFIVLAILLPIFEINRAIT